jgi:adenine deaminase
MKPMLRYGSAAHDVAAQVGAITELGLDSRHFMLCTDDSHAQTLASDGHMDRVLRHAIAEGLPPMTAIQMATLNTAEHFGLSREIGMIAPGRWADILLVDDLADFRPDLVITKGTVAADKGVLKLRLPAFKYPAWARDSVHLRRPVRAADLILRDDGPGTRVTANVIGVQEHQLTTRRMRLEIATRDGEVVADMARDIAKLALIQRHKGMHGTTLGLVHGFGFTARCAAASTIAHDCHQLLVVGTDDACMAQAANELVKHGGGQVVVKDGRVIGLVELTIAGLMSTEHVGIVAAKAKSVLDGFLACGCTLNNPNVLLSFLALTVIPELRISDMGLVDVDRFELLPVLEKV